MSSQRFLPRAAVPLSEAEVERRTTLAFASTNPTDYTPLCQYWFSKGLREGATLSAPRKADVAPSSSEQAADDEGMTREEWVGEAKRVYLESGDDEAFATEQAAWLWAQQDWSSGELESPVDAVQEDLRGRPRPKVTATTAGGLTEALRAALTDANVPSGSALAVIEAFNRHTLATI